MFSLPSQKQAVGVYFTFYSSVWCHQHKYCVVLVRTFFLAFSWWTCCSSVGSLGGAPNYFPNSFNAPESQPRYLESRFKVSPDVARYNSADDDNVTQVMMESVNVLSFVSLQSAVNVRTSHKMVKAALSVHVLCMNIQPTINVGAQADFKLKFGHF